MEVEYDFVVLLLHTSRVSIDRRFFLRCGKKSEGWKLPFNNEAGSRLSERKNGVFSHSLLLDEICEFCRDKLLFFSNCWIKAHFMRRLKEGL